MPNHRMNKTIAGYHLLMILSAVDHKFHIEEEKIIREYIFQEFPFQISLDKEMDIISSLHAEDWHLHFLQCMDDFMDDSTEEERNELIKFAVYLAKADDVITLEENLYLQSIFEAWDYQRE
jgi:hypothetical protein